MVSKGLHAIHPGEFLTETLEELGFSQAAFARVIGVSPSRSTGSTSRTITTSRPPKPASGHVCAPFIPSLTRSPSSRPGERQDDVTRPWARPDS